jgi:leucyl/phenylalanyl-tRNA--protein transferase
MEQDDIVALGGELTTRSLLTAYRNGIFPWPDPEFAMMIWASPVQRGVLDFDDLHIPRSLAKDRKREPYTFTIDKAFGRVIEECAKAYRPGQSGTWITAPMIRAYRKLHELKHAHSVEAWEGEKLVGGLYGMDVDGAFCGESMFHLRPNASKLALLFLVDYLKARGLDWIDIQQLTPHMEALGAKTIPRARFLSRLQETRARGLTLF